MKLKNLISKAVKREAVKGVIGETLPVKSTLLVNLMGSKGKFAAVIAAIAALIAAISELM